MSQPQNNNKSNSHNITDIFNVTPEKIKERVLHFRSLGTEEGTKIANALESLTPADFEPTPNEKKFQKLLDFLTQKRELDITMIEAFVFSFMQIVHQKALTRVFELMAPEVRAKWDEFMSTSPNELQITKLLNFFCEQVTDKNFDELFDEELGLTTESYVDSFQNDLLINEKLEKLTEEEIKELQNLLNEQKIEEAIIMLAKK
jgi:hypothetical protein